MAVEPRDAFGAAAGERRDEFALGIRVAAAGAWKNCHRGNSPRQVILPAALDAEHGAATGIAHRKPGLGHRQEQAAAFREAVEPVRQRMARAGIDVDDVGRREIVRGAIGVDDRRVAPTAQVVRGAPGEPGIVFDCRHPAVSSGEMREDRGVIAETEADMDDVLAGLRRGRRDHPDVQRRLPVVEVALRQDRHDHVVIEIDRIAGRRRHIARGVPGGPHRTTCHGPRPRNASRGTAA